MIMCLRCGSLSCALDSTRRTRHRTVAVMVAVQARLGAGSTLDTATREVFTALDARSA
jgi:hypothetical protein